MKYIVPLKDYVICTDDYTNSESKTLVRNVKTDLVNLGVDYPVQILNANLTIACQLMPPYAL